MFNFKKKISSESETITHSAPASAAGKKEKIVGVCSCPAGVAHTYMAADKLAATAKKMGYDVIVETQGMSGIEDRLGKSDLDEARLIILANEVALREPERFEGYEDKIVKTSISTVLHKTESFLRENLA